MTFGKAGMGKGEDTTKYGTKRFIFMQCNMRNVSFPSSLPRPPVRELVEADLNLPTAPPHFQPRLSVSPFIFISPSVSVSRRPRNTLSLPLSLSSQTQQCPLITLKSSTYRLRDPTSSRGDEFSHEFTYALNIKVR